MCFFLISEMKIPLKIILKLEGKAKASHSGLEGIYMLHDSASRNGYPVWQNKYNYAKIWLDKNGTKWNIGKDYVSAIYSLENGPLENNHWAYYNGSEFIISDDIAVESGNNYSPTHL